MAWPFGADEIAAIDRRLVVPRFAISPSRIEELRDALEQLLRDNPASAREAGVGADRRRQRRRRARQRRFLELAQDPQIVELVSDVIGDDVICGLPRVLQAAHEGYETPWHQDGHYWPIRPLANCTVWWRSSPPRSTTAACA